MHYANWVPLAEANGSFEVDLQAIAARVYGPALDPSMTAEGVYRAMREMVLANLVTVWRVEDKVFGYFEGIEKTGRLPGQKILDRYKNLPPNPPDRRLGLPNQLRLLQAIVERFIGLSSAVSETYVSGSGAKIK